MITKFRLFENISNEKRIFVSRKDFGLPYDILELSEIFWENGFSIYIVGGAVRDFLLNIKAHDYDIVTDAKPDDTIKMLNNKYKILPIGEAFGILKIFTKDNEYEIATFREEEGFSDGRHPDSVVFSDIYSDFKRRDITINSLYYDIKNQQIIDFGTGIEDTKMFVVRTVGDPYDRFREDKLRKMRTIRFASRFGSDIDEETEQSLIKDPNLKGISGERIRDEFIKAINSAESTIYLMELIKKYNMFKEILPDLSIDTDFVEENDYILQLSILLRHNDVTKVKRKLNHLKYTGDEIKNIAFLIEFSKLNSTKGLLPIKGREEHNVVTLKKLQSVTRLSYNQILKFAEDLGMDIRLVETFLAFELSVDGEDVKRDYKYKGADIGREIERQELELFKKSLY